MQEEQGLGCPPDWAGDMGTGTDLSKRAFVSTPGKQTLQAFSRTTGC